MHRALVEMGHEAIVLGDQMPIDSPDTAVIAIAQERRAILVSLNGDFADIVSFPPANFAGVIACQVKNHPEVIPAILERLRVYFVRHPRQGDYEGRLLIVEPHRIRVRR